MDWGELGLGSPHIWLTDPLDAPLAIQGRIRAELSVSTDQIETYFAIRVVDASPDGTLLLLGTAVRRLQTRNGFRAEDRAPAEPGKVYPLEIQLTSTLAYTIPVGHRLGLIVSSSDYPRYDVNPNQGGELMHVVDIFEFEDVELVSVDAQNTLHVGAATPSRLVVPHR
jgi:putative CocE/NonD family hydrolase